MSEQSIAAFLPLVISTVDRIQRDRPVDLLCSCLRKRIASHQIRAVVAGSTILSFDDLKVSHILVDYSTNPVFAQSSKEAKMPQKHSDTKRDGSCNSAANDVKNYGGEGARVGLFWQLGAVSLYRSSCMCVVSKRCEPQGTENDLHHLLIMVWCVEWRVERGTQALLVAMDFSLFLPRWPSLTFF